MPHTPLYCNAIYTHSYSCTQDFYFPEGIGFLISGTDQAMIEMHYDNPGNVEGVITTGEFAG